MRFVGVVLPLVIAAVPAEAACQWTHRDGMPYIACDAAPVVRRPPEVEIREPATTRGVHPAPSPETTAQPAIAGTPTAPVGPPSERPDPISPPPSVLTRPKAAAPSLNLRRPPGLLDPPSERSLRRPSLAR